MSAYDPTFDAAVMAGPIVDNASERLYAIGELEYDGPRCAAEGCDTAVDDDGDRCEDCAVCPTCQGAGGSQQNDGLIVECPRGCMTAGAA